MAFDKDKFWAHVREPIANLLYAGKMKKELKNKDFTILSCNCAAGIIYLVVNGLLTLMMRLIERKALAFERRN